MLPRNQIIEETDYKNSDSNYDMRRGNARFALKIIFVIIIAVVILRCEIDINMFEKLSSLLQTECFQVVKQLLQIMIRLYYMRRRGNNNKERFGPNGPALFKA